MIPNEIGSVSAVISEDEALERWAEFNRRKWKCRAEVKTFKAEGSEATCKSLFFLDRKGKLFLPPLNYYHPVIFRSTPTSKAYKLTRQWLKVAEVMMKEMDETGCPVDFVFSPDIHDVRPWRWANYHVSVKYTYRIHLPFSESDADNSVRRRVEKAQKLGYVVKKADNMSDVHQCLVETAKRKGFNHELSVSDLELMRSVLGEEVFHPYVCYSAAGEPVSASVELVFGQSRALGLVLGSKKEHLVNGVTYLLTECMFDDLAAKGVVQFDFCGANIPSVAESKSQWGAELVPYYTVRKRSFKDLLRESRNWLRSLSAIGSIVGIEILI